jgi:biopolymer transport protein ExbD
MAGVDLGSGQARSRKRKSKRKAKRRLTIRIDMTPMVDVAFLLLTFFMLTTVFRKPQTLEINLPPNEAKVDIAETNLLTLRVDDSDNIYWNKGIEIPTKIQYNDLSKFLSDRGKENPNMVVLIKIDRKSKYHMLVDIIDTLNQDNLTRFSIAPMSDIDRKEMARAIG